MQQNTKQINKDEIKHFLLDENIQVKNLILSEAESQGKTKISFYIYNSIDYTIVHHTLLELLRENFDSLSVIYQLQFFRPRLPNITQIMKEEKLYKLENLKQLLKLLNLKQKNKYFMIYNIKKTKLAYLCAEDALKDICSIKIQCLKKRYNQQPPKYYYQDYIKKFKYYQDIVFCQITQKMNRYSIEDLANLMKGHNIFKVKAQPQQSQSVNGSQSQQSKKKKPENHEEISKSELNNSQKLISEYLSVEKSDKSKQQDSQSQNSTPQQKNLNQQQQKIKIVKAPTTKQNQQQKVQQPIDFDQDSDCMIIEHPF